MPALQASSDSLKDIGKLLDVIEILQLCDHARLRSTMFVAFRTVFAVPNMRYEGEKMMAIL